MTSLRAPVYSCLYKTDDERDKALSALKSGEQLIHNVYVFEDVAVIGVSRKTRYEVKGMKPDYRIIVKPKNVRANA